MASPAGGPGRPSLRTQTPSVATDPERALFKSRSGILEFVKLSEVIKDKTKRGLPLSVVASTLPKTAVTELGANPSVLHASGVDDDKFAALAGAPMVRKAATQGRHGAPGSPAAGGTLAAAGRSLASPVRGGGLGPSLAGSPAGSRAGSQLLPRHLAHHPGSASSSIYEFPSFSVAGDDYGPGSAASSVLLPDSGAVASHRQGGLGRPAPVASEATGRGPALRSPVPRHPQQQQQQQQLGSPGGVATAGRRAGAAALPASPAAQAPPSAEPPPRVRTAASAASTDSSSSWDVSIDGDDQGGYVAGILDRVSVWGGTLRNAVTKRFDGKTLAARNRSAERERSSRSSSPAGSTSASKRGGTARTGASSSARRGGSPHGGSSHSARRVEDDSGGGGGGGLVSAYASFAEEELASGYSSGGSAAMVWSEGGYETAGTWAGGLPGTGGSTDEDDEVALPAADGSTGGGSGGEGRSSTMLRVALLPAGPPPRLPLPMPEEGITGIAEGGGRSRRMRRDGGTGSGYRSASASGPESSPAGSGKSAEEGDEDNGRARRRRRRDARASARKAAPLAALIALLTKDESLQSDGEGGAAGPVKLRVVESSESYGLDATSSSFFELARPSEPLDDDEAPRPLPALPKTNRGRKNSIFKFGPIGPDGKPLTGAAAAQAEAAAAAEAGGVSGDDAGSDAHSGTDSPSHPGSPSRPGGTAAVKFRNPHLAAAPEAAKKRAVKQDGAALRESLVSRRLSLTDLRNAKLKEEAAKKAEQERMKHDAWKKARPLDRVKALLGVQTDEFGRSFLMGQPMSKSSGGAAAAAVEEEAETAAVEEAAPPPSASPRPRFAAVAAAVTAVAGGGGGGVAAAAAATAASGAGDGPGSPAPATDGAPGSPGGPARVNRRGSTLGAIPPPPPVHDDAPRTKAQAMARAKVIKDLKAALSVVNPFSRDDMARFKRQATQAMAKAGITLDALVTSNAPAAEAAAAATTPAPQQQQATAAAGPASPAKAPALAVAAAKAAAEAKTAAAAAAAPVAAPVNEAEAAAAHQQTILERAQRRREQDVALAVVHVSGALKFRVRRNKTRMKLSFNPSPAAQLFYGSTVALESLDGWFLTVHPKSGVMTVREPETRWYERGIMPFRKSFTPSGESREMPYYLFKVIHLKNPMANGPVRYGDPVWFQTVQGRGEEGWTSGSIFGPYLQGGVPLDSTAVDMEGKPLGWRSAQHLVKNDHELAMSMNASTADSQFFGLPQLARDAVLPAMLTRGVGAGGGDGDPLELGGGSVATVARGGAATVAAGPSMLGVTSSSLVSAMPSAFASTLGGGASSSSALVPMSAGASTADAVPQLITPWSRYQQKYADLISLIFEDGSDGGGEGSDGGGVGPDPSAFLSEYRSVAEAAPAHSEPLTRREAAFKATSGNPGPSLLVDNRTTSQKEEAARQLQRQHLAALAQAQAQAKREERRKAKKAAAAAKKSARGGNDGGNTFNLTALGSEGSLSSDGGETAGSGTDGGVDAEGAGLRATTASTVSSTASSFEGGRALGPLLSSRGSPRGGNTGRRKRQYERTAPVSAIAASEAAALILGTLPEPSLHARRGRRSSIANTIDTAAGNEDFLFALNRLVRPRRGSFMGSPTGSMTLANINALGAPRLPNAGGVSIRRRPLDLQAFVENLAKEANSRARPNPLDQLRGRIGVPRPVAAHVPAPNSPQDYLYGPITANNRTGVYRRIDPGFDILYEMANARPIAAAKWVLRPARKAVTVSGSVVGSMGTEGAAPKAGGGGLAALQGGGGASDGKAGGFVVHDADRLLKEAAKAAKSAKRSKGAGMGAKGNKDPFAAALALASSKPLNPLAALGLDEEAEIGDSEKGGKGGRDKSAGETEDDEDEDEDLGGVVCRDYVMNYAEIYIEQEWVYLSCGQADPAGEQEGFEAVPKVETPELLAAANERAAKRRKDEDEEAAAAAEAGEGGGDKGDGSKGGGGGETKSLSFAALALDSTTYFRQPSDGVTGGNRRMAFLQTHAPHQPGPFRVERRGVFRIRMLNSGSDVSTATKDEVAHLKAQLQLRRSERRRIGKAADRHYNMEGAMLGGEGGGLNTHEKKADEDDVHASANMARHARAAARETLVRVNESFLEHEISKLRAPESFFASRLHVRADRDFAALREEISAIAARVHRRELAARKRATAIAHQIQPAFAHPNHTRRGSAGEDEEGGMESATIAGASPAVVAAFQDLRRKTEIENGGEGGRPPPTEEDLQRREAARLAREERQMKAPPCRLCQGHAEGDPHGCSGPIFAAHLCAVDRNVMTEVVSEQRVALAQKQAAEAAEREAAAYSAALYAGTTADGRPAPPGTAGAQPQPPGTPASSVLSPPASKPATAATNRGGAGSTPGTAATATSSRGGGASSPRSIPTALDRLMARYSLKVAAHEREVQHSRLGRRAAAAEAAVKEEARLAAEAAAEAALRDVQALLKGKPATAPAGAPGEAAAAANAAAGAAGFIGGGEGSGSAGEQDGEGGEGEEGAFPELRLRSGSDASSGGEGGGPSPTTGSPQPSPDGSGGGVSGAGKGKGWGGPVRGAALFAKLPKPRTDAGFESLLAHQDAVMRAVIDFQKKSPRRRRY